MTAGGGARVRRRWPLFLGSVLLVALGTRAALPWIAARALEELTGGVLDGQLDIGDVDLGLVEGVVVLEDVTLFAAEDGVELAGAASLFLDLDWGALLRGALEAESFTAREPRLLLAFDAEGRLNWSDVWTEDDEPAADFRVKLARAELGAGSVRLLDASAEGLPSLVLRLGAVALDALEVERPEPGAPVRWALAGADASEWSFGIAPDSEQGFDFALSANAGPVEPDGAIPFRLGVRREDGVELDVEGEVQPTPLLGRVEARWQGLVSRAIVPLLELSGVVIERGRSSGELSATLDLSDVPDRGLRVSARVRHDDLVLDVPGDAQWHVAIPHVEGALRELVIPIPATAPELPEPTRVHWTRVTVREPLVEVTLPAEAGSGAEAAPAPAQETGSAPDEPAPGPGLVVIFDSLRVESGRLVVRDPLGQLPPESDVSVDLEASQVRLPLLTFGESQLRVRGRRAGSLHLDGALGEDRGDVRLRARRIDLVHWNPVIEQYSSYSVTRGELSVKSRLELRGRRYEAPTDLTFHRLEARSTGKDFQKTFGMPMAVALPLLADTAGNIRIRVPVEGDVDSGGRLDLQATFADALREAVRNTLVNSLAAPLDVAGSIFRRIGEAFVLGIGEAVFRPGTSDLPPDARVVLDSAAQLVLRTKGARLLLVSDIVEDDLEALGLTRGEAGLLADAARIGRAIFGGGGKVSSELREAAEELTRARYRAVRARLTTRSGLRPDQIVPQPWDGTVREGFPRVKLRLRLQ